MPRRGTWVALDAETKLAICWLLGKRDATYAYVFIQTLAARLANRVQLTTDGYHPYLEAVEDTSGANIDYAMLVKLYGTELATEARYSPPVCIGINAGVVQGNPDPDHISISFVERSNLTMRIHMRRFTRLANAFSKKVENLQHALALHFHVLQFR